MFYYLLIRTDTKERCDVLAYDNAEMIQTIKDNIVEKNIPLEIKEISEEYYHWLIDKWYRPM